MTVRATCVKVALPEAFSMPRKFGFSWGRLVQKAYNGLDVGHKGVCVCYVLSYDAVTGYYATWASPLKAPPLKRYVFKIKTSVLT